MVLLRLDGIHGYFCHLSWILLWVGQMAKVSMDTFTDCNRSQKYPWIFWPPQKPTKSGSWVEILCVLVRLCVCVAVCACVHHIYLLSSFSLYVSMNRRKIGHLGDECLRYENIIEFLYIYD